MPKYDITVKLLGEDGNAYAILSRVSRAMKSGGVPQEEIDVFCEEATSEDYDHLLQTVMEWVEVD